MRTDAFVLLITNNRIGLKRVVERDMVWKKVERGTRARVLHRSRASRV